MVAEIAEGSHLRGWSINKVSGSCTRNGDDCLPRAIVESFAESRCPRSGNLGPVNSLPRSMRIFTVEVPKSQEPYKMKCGDAETACGWQFTHSSTVCLRKGIEAYVPPSKTEQGFIQKDI